LRDHFAVHGGKREKRRRNGTENERKKDREKNTSPKMNCCFGLGRHPVAGPPKFWGHGPF